MASSCLKYPLNTLPERTRISPLVADLHLDARQRAADGMQPHFVRALDGVVGAGFGLAVELAQLDAERAVKDERILAHRLAAGEGAAQPRQAELVLDRSVNQPLAERVEQPLASSVGAPAVELAPFRRNGRRHEEIVDPLLQPGGVFHADLDRGQ